MPTPPAPSGCCANLSVTPLYPVHDAPAAERICFSKCLSTGIATLTGLACIGCVFAWPPTSRARHMASVPVPVPVTAVIDTASMGAMGVSLSPLASRLEDSESLHGGETLVRSLCRTRPRYARSSSTRR